MLVSSRRVHHRSTVAAGIAAALIPLLLLLASTAGPAVNAQGPPRNGAGLVVRHGDGTFVYAYVEFDSETISGEELLLRAGLDFVVAPFGGLGAGVCAINGEGCPADDCYCQSYSSPAYYWNYYSRTADSWAVQLRGPSGRQLADGDIDGWSWTTGDHGLPPVTIDEIATLTGFNRNPEPTATATLAPTATFTPATATATATIPPLATNTPILASTATATAVPTTAPLPSPTPPATATQPVATTPSASATSTTVATATATNIVPTSTSTPSPAPSPSPPAPTLAATSTGSGAVIVRPGETPEALASEDGDNTPSGSELAIFGGFAAIAVAAGMFVVVKRRRVES